VSGSAASIGPGPTIVAIAVATARTVTMYAANLRLRLIIVLFDSQRLRGWRSSGSVTLVGFLRQLLNTNRPVKSSE
jgi:hypothetical protein